MPDNTKTAYDLMIERKRTQKDNKDKNGK